MKSVYIQQACSMILTGILLVACSGSDAESSDKTFSLYNYSSGSPRTAGFFTITKIDNGLVSLHVQLDPKYLSPENDLDAYLTTCDTCMLIYSTLQTVDGNSGTGTTKAIKTDGNNEPILYDSLILKKGFAVRILNGSNVQAVGVIK